MNYIANMLFPKEYINHKYSLIHFNFFLQYAKIARVNVDLVPSNKQVFIGRDNNLFFSCAINNKQVIIDYSDHYYSNWKHLFNGIPYFKFQTTDKSNKSIIPLGPPIVGVKQKRSTGETLRSFFSVKQSFNYTPGNSILCKQLPNGNATERRIHVQKLLQNNFKITDTSANDDQLIFWNKHENCALAVCVPGANNNMIDRGQMELFGLGVCTVSPTLNTKLPFKKNATENVHYLKCNDDYSNLIEIINKVKHDTETLKRVGNNAQNLFDEIFTPKRYWQWILLNI